MQILAFSLPGGFLGSIVTWIFSRRKQNNDFLKELQSSINLLSGENKKILEENIQLRRENIDIKANQEEMLIRIDRLTKEVERLRKTIGKRNNYEDKTLFSVARRTYGGMRVNEKVLIEQPGDSCGYHSPPATGRTRHRRKNDSGENELQSGGDLCATGSPDGVDSSADNGSDSNGGEPP